MEKRYGIFMKIGEPKNYGPSLTGVGLVKMNLSDFASEKEAVDFINKSDFIPSNVEYDIIAYTVYRKPNPSA